ncbi:hypothetical protein H2203_006636 [Taxawa tesnikishii (nom. ined.)]|nr:hypothetical protein H2203_006636 [Dothideales sp. JES 119]
MASSRTFLIFTLLLGSGQALILPGRNVMENYKRTTPQHRRDTAARVFARQTASSAQIYAAEVNATLNAAVNALELRDALQAQCDNSTIGSSNSTVCIEATSAASLVSSYIVQTVTQLFSTYNALLLLLGGTDPSLVADNYCWEIDAPTLDSVGLDGACIQNYVCSPPAPGNTSSSPTNASTAVSLDNSSTSGTKNASGMALLSSCTGTPYGNRTNLFTTTLVTLPPPITTSSGSGHDPYVNGSIEISSANFTNVTIVQNVISTTLLLVLPVSSGSVSLTTVTLNLTAGYPTAQPSGGGPYPRVLPRPVWALQALVRQLWTSLEAIRLWILELHTGLTLFTHILRKLPYIPYP